jgi:hypothetical protein
MSLLEALRERLEDLGPWDPVRTPRVVGAGIGLSLFAWVVRRSEGYVPILDDANLAFHEAGHPLFGLFGETAMLYGGTLGQLVFPVVVLVTFALRRQVMGVVVGLCWIGQNLVNIARYCADARAQELPLVGGGEHDWFNILTRWGVLERDLVIAGWIRTLGWLFILGAAIFVFMRWWADRDRPVEVRERFG